MRRMSRAPAFVLALVLPGIVLATAHHLLLAQILWLWIYFAIILTVASLLLTWIFYRWREGETDGRSRRAIVSVRPR